jgi:acetate kinase
MRILIANAGSSSLRLRLLGDEGILADAHLDARSIDDATAIDEFLRSLPAEVDAVGHRVVHGGPSFRGPVLADDTVVDALDRLSILAPLHQPPAVTAMRLLRSRLPGVPQVACFDTAFHATLPAAAYTYAIPAAWREDWGLRRYGFHGLSHAYASRRAAELVGDDRSRRTVVCHLGAGASLCAVLDGRSVDTTMGFTPLEGLVMATRSGNVDPGLLLWLLTDGGLAADEIERALRERSGLAGLTGGSGDMREVLAARAAGDSVASAAFDVYVHRLASAVAAMAAALGGVDVVVFTGGVGENSPEVRAATGERLAFLGMELDGTSNDVTGASDREISPDGALVRTLVVHAREDLEIARGVRSVIAASGSTN